MREEIFYDEIGLTMAVETETEDGEIIRIGNWPVIHGERKPLTGTSQKTL